jgi:hypothetical protein
VGRVIVVPVNPQRQAVEDPPDLWPRRTPASIRADPLWQFLRQRSEIDVIRRLDAIGLLDDDERQAWALLLRDRDGV